MSDIYGLIGLILILAGWVYETFLVLRKIKMPLPLGFAALYGIGSLLLAIHSWMLNDLVFLILNIAATLIAIINISFILNLISNRPKNRIKRK